MKTTIVLLLCLGLFLAGCGQERYSVESLAAKVGIGRNSIPQVLEESCPAAWHHTGKEPYYPVRLLRWLVVFTNSQQSNYQITNNREVSALLQEPTPWSGQDCLGVLIDPRIPWGEARNLLKKYPSKTWGTVMLIIEPVGISPGKLGVLGVQVVEDSKESLARNPNAKWHTLHIRLDDKQDVSMSFDSQMFSSIRELVEVRGMVGTSTWYTTAHNVCITADDDIPWQAVVMAISAFANHCGGGDILLAVSPSGPQK